MATIACPHCSRRVSTAAVTCPHCRRAASTAANAPRYSPCRACGTQLRTADHKRETQTPYMRNGNTEYHSSTQHWPCSQCGDPKPLLKWHDNGLLVNAIVIAVLAVIAYGGYLKLVGWA